MRLSKSKKVALLSAFSAAAVIFSYAEAVLPFSVLPIAGFRLGFSNIAVLCVLYLFGGREAISVMAIRTAINSLLFTGLLSMTLSLSGGILSLITMILLKKCGKFSIVGISVAGATMHNIGQILAASLILQDISVVSYIPVLMVLSIVCGSLIGIVSMLILKILKNSKQF